MNAEEGASYFLDYTFKGHEYCELTCVRQVFSQDGEHWDKKPGAQTVRTSAE